MHKAVLDNTTIISTLNSYKAAGDSIGLNRKIKVVFENNKFSTAELRTAQIFEDTVKENLP